MKKHAVVVDCPIETAINVVKGKCKINLILNINKGINKFGMLKKSMTISDKLLSRQLAELEEDKIIIKETKDNNPLSTTYYMTADGVRLCEIFGTILDWGQNYSLYQDFKRSIT